MALRAARLDDIPVLRAIEWASAQPFHEYDLGDVADEEPRPGEDFARYIETGRCWVATDDDDDPIGYLLAQELDGCTHIEQVSVLPDHQGAGHGRALIERAVSWARENRDPAVTLTTYSHVRWNQPLYEHLGFRVLDQDEIGPELATRRAEETARGLSPEFRVAMRLDVAG